ADLEVQAILRVLSTSKSVATHALLRFFPTRGIAVYHPFNIQGIAVYHPFNIQGLSLFNDSRQIKSESTISRRKLLSWISHQGTENGRFTYPSARVIEERYIKSG
ncbi:MAG: hypothetical protein AAFX78_19810, partial [Cyanobacteria bacterium J06638_20]